MKRSAQRNAFTIIEMMMSLVILAMLMTAVAFAFDASVENYNANQGIYKTVNTGRQALL
ncbi:MAG: type II secretion system protein, partial [Planctomycetota bacterium]